MMNSCILNFGIPNYLVPNTLILHIMDNWFQEGFVKCTLMMTQGEGMVCFSEEVEYPGTVLIHDLSVTNIFRKMGYGKRLMHTVERIAKSLDFCKCALYVREDSWQKDWYARLGYVTESEAETDEGYIKMVKKLC